MNYATIGKELLCVIATVCEFCSILLGSELQFTQITKTFLMLVTHLNDIYDGYHMSMNKVPLYTMWKAHAMSLQNLLKTFTSR